MSGRRTWREKLADSKDLPKLERIPKRMVSRFGTGTLLIPAPIEVDGVMRGVRKGKLTTINEIRAALARKHKATLTCPMTTGIFAWIAANAAHEDEAVGKRHFTPYWRTLKVEGELNPKYPGGMAAQRRRLQAEGHKVIARGKRWFVDDFESRLARF